MSGIEVLIKNLLGIEKRAKIFQQTWPIFLEKIVYPQSYNEISQKTIEERIETLGFEVVKED